MMYKMGKAVAAGACVFAAMHTVAELPQGVEATNSSNNNATTCAGAATAVGAETDCKPAGDATFTKAAKTCETTCKNKITAMVNACSGAEKTKAQNYLKLCDSTDTSAAMQRLETWVGTAVAFGLALAAF